MIKPPTPKNENARLRTLTDLAILDTLPESVYDDITLLASQICGTPIALISLVDNDRQWFKSRVGLDLAETPREVSFCAHALESDETIFEIPNARVDDRFAGNPLVKGPSNFAFYAGAPLVAPTGVCLGTLCVIDERPKNLDDAQKRALSALASQVMALFEARKTARRLNEQQQRERDLTEIAEADRIQLQLVFDVSPVGMALVRGPDFNFEKVNEAFKSLFAQREYLGRNWVEVYEELADSPFFEIMTKVYLTGKRYAEKNVPVTVLAASGQLERRFHNLTYDRIEGPDGLSHGVLLQAVDVTEEISIRHEVIEKETLAAELRLRLHDTLHSMPISVSILEGPEHEYSYVNDAHTDIYGGTADFVGKTFREAVPSLESSRIPALLDEVFASGQPFYDGEFTIDIPQANGSTRVTITKFSMQPLSDIHGTVTGVAITAVDVTDLVNARREIAHQSDLVRTSTAALTRLAAVVESSQDFIGMSDVHFRPIFLNDGGRKMSGFGGREIRRARIKEFFVPRDFEKLNSEVVPGLMTDGFWRGELALKHFETGATIPVYYDIFQILDPETSKPIAYATVTRDISERKTFEKDIRESRDLAEKANSAKSAFLANMSHEIRSPLGAIMGFATLLKDPGLVREELLNFAGIIERNSHHVLRIVDDILDLSKVEAGKMLIEHIVFSLSDLLADFTSLMALKARDKGVDFHLEMSSSIPECIYSDPTRLRQILTNIVGNAIKFTERGQVRMSVRYHDRQLHFSVRDTGVGLSQEQARRLFRAFHQSDSSTTRKFGGTGLGLVLTRRLAEAMGGFFDLQSSEVGVGSIFAASIKIDPKLGTDMVDSVGVNGVATTSANHDPAPRPLQGMKILVIEDSPDNRALFEIMLTGLGATVDLANDGLDGVKAALGEKYDVVLCDVQMPRMDGYEAVRELTARGYPVPIVALTAHAMKEERERAIAAGFSDFLSKPVQKDALIKVLLKSQGAIRSRSNAQPQLR